MGFIGKIFKTIFSPSVPQVQVQAPEITGRELVAETSSLEPEAPSLGSEGKTNKKRGINSLLVPTNDLYRGGL